MATRFSQNVFDAICDRIAQGESLRAICKDEDMPTAQNFCKWLARDETGELRQQYARAREDQADTIFDEILEIADNATNDWMERQGEGAIGYQLNGEHVQRSRLRIDARKWMAGKLRPKVYGEKLDLSSTDGSMTPTVIERVIVRPNGD